MFVLASLALAANLGLLAAWVFTRSQLPVLGAEPPESLPDSPPMVSVLIPARNEEDGIRDCIISILDQEYPHYEVIVINDGSTDRTGEILASMAPYAVERDVPLRILDTGGKPEGWAGKNYALTQGVKEAKGEYLLFIDADTVPRPIMLRQGIGRALREGSDLLTIVPRPLLKGFWDRVANGFIFLMAPIMRLHEINDPTKPTANANGPFMLFTRRAYEAIGGHEAVAAEIWEDAILAEHIKESGHTLRYYFAPELMGVYLYANLPDLLDGWSKIEYRRLELGRLTVIGEYVNALVVVLFFVLPWVMLPVYLVSWIGTGRFLHLVTATLFFASCAVIVRTLRYVEDFMGLRDDTVYPLMNGFGAGAVAYMVARTAWRFQRGLGASWKGNTYSLKEGDPEGS